MTEALCNSTRLAQLLSESLSKKDEQDLSVHLSSCSGCQRELESLAGDAQWWSETRHRLMQSSFGGAHTADTLDDGPLFDVSDFAVDFLEPSEEKTALGRLGQYEIVEMIGRGGMGIVLKGYQKELHRYVAVKVLSPHLATSGAARKRFAREAQATAAVVHPHVMAIHAVHPSAKLPYLVMPYVSCQSLQERLDQFGALPLVDVLRIGYQAALGLAAAHAQGLVHRDVKPANILLETNVDRVLLTDFGLARAVDDATLTRTGIIAGTPQYMSPEQANGDSVGHRSDLFSLGGVLYALCTGRPPFRAETTFGVLQKIREVEPRSIREINPEVPDWLVRIVLKLLAKDPVNRFDSANDIAKLLETCLAHVQQPTAVPLPTHVGDWPLVVPVETALTTQTPSIFSSQSRNTVLVALVLLLSLTGVYLGRRPVEPESPFAEKVNSGYESSSILPPTDKLPLEWNATQHGLDAVFDAFDQLETPRDVELPQKDVPASE